MPDNGHNNIAHYHSFGNDDALTCCISTLARLLLIRRNSEDFRLLSLCSRFCRRCLCMLLFASLLCHSSRLRPPVLMEVFSSGVERRVTWSPPDNNSCRTWVWYRPCTASPLICVMRSPGRTPDSNAGLPSSTACNIKVNLKCYQKVYAYLQTVKNLARWHILMPQLT